MQVKRIQCPSCGVVLDVKNSSNATEKIISCPKCKVQLKVKFKPVIAPNEPIEAHTYLGAQKKQAQPQYQQNSFKTQLGGGLGNGRTQGAASAETRLAGATSSFETLLASSPNGVARKRGNVAYLEFRGKQYFLSLGRNVIGRKATTIHATVEIDTDDLYMSRRHCVINVEPLPDGSIKAVLTNPDNKNVTVNNKMNIGQVDEVRLTDGNIITMGKTTLTFKLS